MTAGPRRTAWIIAPPEVCSLCREPMTQPSEVSAWNGRPAHRDCVRVHLIQRDPAFREPEEPTDESADSVEGLISRDDEDTE